MSCSTIRKCHIIKTLRVYPRVHYFQRRYHDLIPRFKRLTGAFQKSFLVDKLMIEIDDIDDKFINALSICVIGQNDIDLANILVSTKPLAEEKFSELKEPSRISLYICHTKTERLNQSGLESIREAIETFDNDIVKGNKNVFEDMFVVIDVEHNHTDKEQDSFRAEVYKMIHTKLQGTDIQIPEGRVIFGLHDSTVLGSKISEHLETMLIAGFHKVMVYLERFVKKTKQFQHKDEEVLRTDLVVKSIQALLRDDIGLADMRKIAERDESKETEGLSMDDKFLHQLLKKIARLVKCAIVEPLSVRYNIPSWIVNLLLEEIEFEHKAIESVSRNTKHHLRKLNEFSKDYEEILETHKRKANMGKEKFGASRHEYFIRYVSFKFDFIVYPLQNDMSKLINDVEKTMDSAQQIIIVMGKMMFEIEGYLEQTITEKYEPTPLIPDSPMELKQAILQLRDVYGIGRVYDYIEIHVNRDEGTFTEDIPMLMHKYGFSQPYQIKTVTHKPEKLMANIQHKNGKLIKSPFPEDRFNYREGTLGCFAENDSKMLYVLTCAHVVQNPNEEEHDVFIPDRGLKLKAIGKSTRYLTVCSGDGEMPVIDIAAVTVNEDFVKHCIRKMKDDNGHSPQAITEEMERVPAEEMERERIKFMTCMFLLAILFGNRKFLAKPDRLMISCITVYLLGNDGAHSYNGNGILLSTRRKYTRFNDEELFDEIQPANLPLDVLQRQPTDKEIARISGKIGKEYRRLAYELGLTCVQLDHLTEDYIVTEHRIERMLFKWRDGIGRNATFEILVNALDEVGISPDIVSQSLERI